MVKKTESELGPVDIVVNNAGVFYFTLMTNSYEDEWEQMIDVNCKVGLSCSIYISEYAYVVHIMPLCANYFSR